MKIGMTKPQLEDVLLKTYFVLFFVMEKTLNGETLVGKITNGTIINEKITQ